MISYSSLVEFRETSVIGEVSGRFHAPPPCGLTLPFVPSHPSHPIEGIFDMQHTYCVYLGGMQHTFPMEQVKWSSFDQFWVDFHGELLGEDVISWPCSFRGQNNTFRDLRALGLSTFMIGVAVPKNVYNSCPLKHEVINLLMSSEMLYHEDLNFFQAGRRPVIRYNTIHHLHNIFIT